MDLIINLIFMAVGIQLIFLSKNNSYYKDIMNKYGEEYAIKINNKTKHIGMFMISVSVFGFIIAFCHS